MEQPDKKRMGAFCQAVYKNAIYKAVHAQRASAAYFAGLKPSLSRTLRLNTRCSAEQSLESMQK